MIDFDPLKVALRNLAILSRKQLDEAVSNNTYPPFCSYWKRRKVLPGSVQYLNTFNPQYSHDTEQYIRQEWMSLIMMFPGHISNFAEYQSAKTLLDSMPSPPPSDALDNFINRLIYHHRYKNDLSNSAIDNLINILINEWCHKSVICKVFIGLMGLTAPATPISFGVEEDKVTIRRTNEADLEEETSEGFEFHYTSMIPSSVIEIEYKANSNEKRLKVSQALAIVRLFRLGTVFCLYHDLKVESVLFVSQQGKALGGEQTGGVKHQPFLISDDDSTVLKEFWHDMSRNMPKGCYDSLGNENIALSISYQRYTDSLLNNGLFERRIASAMMGLESIYMSSETDLSGYKISHRGAKILAYFGFDPLSVKKTMQVGYGIRSTFAHGDILTKKKRKKHEGDLGEAVESILPTLQEYLRVSIIAMILAKIPKHSLVPLIDKSFIHENSNKEVKDLFSPLIARIPLKRS